MSAMIPSDAIEVPGAWEHLPIAELHGLIMVIGAADVVKSTFTQYLARRVAESGVTVAELDGDPGQSRLGPPATISLALYTADEVQHPDRVATRRMFIGSVTPSG
ncbi:MAG: Clp1/GlmU family protein, partial [Anaerolineales bacterium]|nr:Clp1/GlmU family protein [Anaerolineales bacterium]